MKIFQLNVSFMRWSFRKLNRIRSNIFQQRHHTSWWWRKTGEGVEVAYVTEKLFKQIEDMNVENTSSITVWKSMKIHFPKTYYGSSQLNRKKHLQPKQTECKAIIDCKLNFSSNTHKHTLPSSLSIHLLLRAQNEYKIPI